MHAFAHAHAHIHAHMHPLVFTATHTHTWQYKNTDQTRHTQTCVYVCSSNTMHAHDFSPTCVGVRFPVDCCRFKMRHNVDSLLPNKQVSFNETVLTFHCQYLSLSLTPLLYSNWIVYHPHHLYLNVYSYHKCSPFITQKNKT